ncbi:MAG: PfkB family carbohydrate kinase [candidate division KSB1 bacterium]|nr:PfkB family carbohydrate kinase [candidate division KSB1 bacterium]
MNKLIYDNYSQIFTFLKKSRQIRYWILHPMFVPLHMSQNSTYLSVCLNPVLQRTVILDDLQENRVNRSRDYRLDASGKGINVTRVLQQLGGSCLHLTQAGGHFLELFLKLAAQDQLRVNRVESGTDIRICTTLLNRARRTTTEIVEEGRRIEPETGTRLFDAFLKCIDAVDGLIISGSKAPGFSDTLHADLVREAKQRSKRVILDTRGADLVHALRYTPDMIKPNLSEFAATFFPDADPDSQETLQTIEAKMLKLDRQGILCILTDGSRAVRYAHQGRIHRLIPEPLQPVNTIGCGDAFTAGLAAYLGRGSIEQAIQQGIDCARANAQLLRPGVIR